MSDEKITAHQIFSKIKWTSISKEMGISLIENYGIQKQKEFINQLQEEYPVYSPKIIETIEKLNKQLDEMLKSIIGVEN
jgi:hypothetical protein